MARNIISAFLMVSVIAATGGLCRAEGPITGIEKQPEGLILRSAQGVLRVEVWSEDVIRVTYAPGGQLPALKSLTVIATPAATAWRVEENPDSVVLATNALHVTVDRKTGAVAFLDTRNQPILRESVQGRELAPATTPGAGGPGRFLIRQSFILPPEEGIYGLGQHQQGIWDYRGHVVQLQQENREIAVPVILSSRGYSLLWDNPAVTDVSIGAPHVAGAKGPEGAGEGVLRWSSETGKAIDYYFIDGPSEDAAMGRYRTLTGEAPLMPKWLWGFWQCKERYKTQEELIGIVQRYRDLKVPLDGIIQDWQYWAPGTWGSHVFDPARYPGPAGMFKTIHALHAHALISVWPKFDLGTPNIEQLEKAGAMYAPVIPYVFPKGQGKWYDAFSAAGRRIYWEQISRELFSLGVDGWWLDAPEPELSGKWGEFRMFTTADGPGATVYNAYPLMHSTGIYEGQRAQTVDKRVVILTRSAYAGQQRNSAISWSGDIGGTWEVLQHQIPAGLNFSVSGIPYWNTDIGGFFGDRRTGNENAADPRYQELFSRWFEYGSFTPMFRVHGSEANKEFWRWPDATQKVWRKFVDLRYRLLPYIYSTSWQVTSKGGTLMRPLVMDFADDPQACRIGDQYLFGPALMVNPVTTQGATSRSVYLPGKAASDAWYDFWTGKRLGAGERVDAAAPIDRLPLYVRGGAILPMGPLLQYVDEKAADPLEIRVYRGADGAFTLYEDEGDSYRYEKGAYAVIPFAWNDARGTLTIGDRAGNFPGMLHDRTFNIVFVNEQHGDGVAVSDSVDHVVKYSGKAVSVKAGGQGG